MGVLLVAAAGVAAQWLAPTLQQSSVGLLVVVVTGALASLVPVARAHLATAACAGVVAVFLAWATLDTLEPPDDASHVSALLADGLRSAGRVRMVVCAVGPARVSGAGARLVVEARELLAPERRRLAGRVSLFIRYVHRAWQPGDCFAFSSTLRRITNFGNPGEFDWAGWNARRGQFVSAFLWNDEEVEERSAPAGGRPFALARLRDRITRAILRGTTGGGRALVAALVTGDRSALDEATVESIRAAGLSHVLAISGLHMGLVAGILLWVVTRIVLRTRAARAGIDPYRPAAAVAAAGVAAYALVSGGGVSVARSVLMVAVMLLALWRGRPADARRALAWAALCLSLVGPGVALEAGFQLSFVAVAGLTVYGARRTALAELRPSALRWLVESLTVSTLTWWVTAPIVAQHFHRISLVAPVANVAAALPVAATVLLGLAGTAVLGLHGPLADALYALAAYSADLTTAVASAVAALPGAGLPVPAPGWPLAATLVSLPFAAAAPRRLRGILLSGLVVVLLVTVGTAFHDRYRGDRMDIVFVSVGQGDATVVRLPGGKVLLVDAGVPGRGRLAIVPLLRRMRIGRIDYLVVTHVQNDHWGGVTEIVEELDVGELWYPGGRCENARFIELLRALGEREIRAIDVGAALAAAALARPGVVRSEPTTAFGEPAASVVRSGPDGWRLRALWPREEDGACDANDRSVVLMLRFGGRAVLLTGDIEAHAEQRLAADGGLRADLLKAPHHGSRTSSTAAFVDAVGARAVVASVGLGNRYGFPHAEIEARYREAGAELFRTDRDGAVVAAIDASGLRVGAANPR